MNEQLLTPEEAASILDCSIRSLKTYQKKGLPVHYHKDRPGKPKYYIQSELQDFAIENGLADPDDGRFQRLRRLEAKACTEQLAAATLAAGYISYERAEAMRGYGQQRVNKLADIIRDGLPGIIELSPRAQKTVDDALQALREVFDDMTFPEPTGTTKTGRNTLSSAPQNRIDSAIAYTLETKTRIANGELVESSVVAMAGSGMVKRARDILGLTLSLQRDMVDLQVRTVDRVERFLSESWNTVMLTPGTD